MCLDSKVRTAKGTAESEAALAALLSRKGLAQIDQLFSVQNELSFASDISRHAAWAFENIYSRCYPNRRPRSIHGIRHTSRVAYYIPVLANLYRKHKEQSVTLLDDIKLLQIAALFHDAAREDDGEDKWDHESAILLYNYLTRVLRVDNEKASLIAEATANKDVDPRKGFFRISTDADHQQTWGFDTSLTSRREKNIFQKLIHDADCLDIIRARKVFSAEYLDFYKDIASKPGNTLALNEMAHLIMEVRSLIELQGDTFCEPSEKEQRIYETPDGYDLLQQLIQTHVFPILQKLGRNVFDIEILKKTPLFDSSPYNPAIGYTESNLQAALNNGEIFVRGIESPLKVSEKHKESHIALELRKSFRTEGIATLSKKENALKKNGNPKRSVSMIGYGSGLFAKTGLMIFQPNLRDIQHVFAVDKDTGRGKKSSICFFARQENLTEIKQQLDNLLHRMKLGGQLREFNHREASTHNEIIYNIRTFDAVYYTTDNCLTNKWFQKSSCIHHRELLTAIFIRNEYERQYAETHASFIKTFGQEAGEAAFIRQFGEIKRLPILRFSALHNTLKQVPESELTDEHILKLWLEYSRDVMKSKREFSLHSLSVEAIKSFDGSSLSAESNYSPVLRRRIDETITIEREKMLQEEKRILSQLIEKNTKGILSFDANRTIALFCAHPELIEAVKPEFIQEINSMLTTISFNLKSLTLAFWVPQYNDEIKCKIKRVFDLNRIVERNDSPLITYHIFSNNFLRLYALCNTLHLEEQLNLIKQKVGTILDESLNLMEQAFTQASSLDSRMKILAESGAFFKAVMIFDLSAPYSDRWIALFCNYLNDLESMPGFVTVMKKLIEYDLLNNPAIQEALRKPYTQLKNRSDINTADDDQFILLVKAGAALQDVCGLKSMAYHWICDTKRAALSKSFMEEIFKYIPMDSDNSALFRAVLHKIPLYTYNSNGYGYGAGYDYPYGPFDWYVQVMSFKKYSTKGSFSPEQENIIEESWAEIIDDYCQRVAALNFDHALSKFQYYFSGDPFDLLKKITEQENISIPMSEPLYDLLNKRLEQIIDLPLDAVDGTFECDNALKMLDGLHQKLPHKEKRDPLYNTIVLKLKLLPEHILCKAIQEKNYTAIMYNLKNHPELLSKVDKDALRRLYMDLHILTHYRDNERLAIQQFIQELSEVWKEDYPPEFAKEMFDQAQLLGDEITAMHAKSILQRHTNYSSSLTPQ